MEFYKVHGLGNDFILIDYDDGEPDLDFSEFALQFCDRRKGIGADGVLLLLPSKVADSKMRIFNSDGSEAEMCGNGIRCFARYLYEIKKVEKPSLSIETLAGVIETKILLTTDRKFATVRVAMGKPVFNPKEIPIMVAGEEVVDYPLQVEDKNFFLTAVSMGNPHAVIFVDSFDGLQLEEWGRAIEISPLFPNKTNVEFVKVLSKNEAEVVVWERGAGATLACGTGACAVMAAGRKKGFFSEKIKIKLPGGDLLLEWKNESEPIYMEGTAEFVFTGKLL